MRTRHGILLLLLLVGPCTIAETTVGGKLDEISNVVVPGLEGWRFEQVETDTLVLGTEHFTVFQNYLVPPEGVGSIALARSAISKLPSARCVVRYGLDAATLSANWLEPQTALWVRWRTYGQGSGSYTWDGHVILTKAEGEFREIFRDNFCSSARAGWAAQSHTELSVAYNVGDATLAIVRKTHEVSGAREPILAGESMRMDSGDLWYVSTTSTLDTWNYVLVGDTLRFEGGTKAIDLGEKRFPLSEVAARFNADLSSLRMLNPSLTEKDSCSGLILLSGKTAPYQTTAYDGLWGDGQPPGK